MSMDVQEADGGNVRTGSLEEAGRNDSPREASDKDRNRVEQTIETDHSEGGLFSGAERAPSETEETVEVDNAAIDERPGEAWNGDAVAKAVPMSIGVRARGAVGDFVWVIEKGSPLQDARGVIELEPEHDLQSEFLLEASATCLSTYSGRCCCRLAVSKGAWTPPLAAGLCWGEPVGRRQCFAGEHNPANRASPPKEAQALGGRHADGWPGHR